MTIDTSKWNKVSFGDVARCLTVATKDPLSEGLERYVGLEHIEPGNIHIKSWGEVAKGTTFTRVFRKGQVLFGKRRAYQKKAALAEFDGICSSDILVCEAIEGKLIPELLPFVVQSDRFFDFAIKTSAGSLSPRTKFKDLAKFSLKLPSKPDDQKRIADLLWSIDKTIESYAKILNRLSVTYQIELKNMATIKGNEKKVGDVAHLHYGDGLREKDRHDGPYLVVGSSGVVGKHIECRVQGPGIVVGRKGSAGEVLWIDTDFWPIDTTYYVEIKSPKDMNLEYFYYVLKSLDLPSLTITTAVPGLNRDDVLLKTIKVPGLSVQAKVVERFRSIQLVKEKVNSHILHTKNIQKQIINQMFG